MLKMVKETAYSNIGTAFQKDASCKVFVTGALDILVEFVCDSAR
jgi:hypothetical protein